MVPARLPSPEELVNRLEEHVIGQQRAKKMLANAVYRHYLARASGDDPGSQHQLLLGPTGVGKSLLVRAIGKVLGVPVAFTAATSLVETGYVGTPVEHMFQVLLARAGGDVELAERGIVFLDEFDKLRRADVGRDVSGEGVQNGLLTLLDGRPVRVRHRDREAEIDSTNVLFLCTGAFAGLAAIVRQRLSRDHAGFGFTGAARRRDPASDAALLAQAGTDDLIEFGIIPELVGRFGGIVPLEPFTPGDLLRVLNESKHSPLRALVRHFELHGVRLEVPDDARGAIVDRALQQGLGARALRRVVNEVFAPLEYRLSKLVADGVGSVIMTRAAIEGRGKPQLRHRRSMPDWAPPVPSAEQLCFGALAPRARVAPPPPRAPRERATRHPRPAPFAPTLFEDPPRT